MKTNPCRVTDETQKFEETTHLPLSEKFVTIQIETISEAIAGEMEIPIQTVTL